LQRVDPYTSLSIGILPTFVPCGFLKQGAIWAACEYTALLVYKEKKTLFKDPLKGDQDAKLFLP